MTIHGSRETFESIEKRVDDLLARMTIEEKLGQLEGN